MGKQLVPQSVVNEIVKELERRIVEGELTPGQRLVESALSEEWGVSRTSLREAFRRLESMGYVTYKPRRGVSVSQLSPDHVRQIYQVRAVLEELVVQLAVQNCDETLLDELKQLDSQMLQAYAKNDTKKYARLNALFHQHILDATKNDFLQKVMLSIHKNVERCMAYCRPGHQGDSNISHRQLIQLFEKKDAVAAGKARHDRVLVMSELVIQCMTAQQKQQTGRQ